MLLHPCLPVATPCGLAAHPHPHLQAFPQRGNLTAHRRTVNSTENRTCWRPRKDTLARKATNGSCFQDLFKKREWDVPWTPTSPQKGRGELLLIADPGHCSHAELDWMMPQPCLGWLSIKEQPLSECWVGVGIRPANGNSHTAWKIPHPISPTRGQENWGPEVRPDADTFAPVK